MINFEFLLGHYNYWAVIVLFLIGLYAMIVKKNLIKKFMGLNIMDTSIFLFYISMGDVEGGVSPIIAHGGGSEVIYVNPLPSVLILTAIVVAVSTTALALSLIIKIYEEYGTLDSERLVELMGW
ncbi:MAG: cation:proton antiporter subunit C [Methanocellales archaeon]|nr:cation:proton antiporter subunit C [Methanocellales archaeon]MDD4898163.1 cation:proton antiporter subunit C [Methanocellales archaeon]MDD5446751.1 cation:proton antiporter subunit C [Methanocellales archaeon]